MAATRNSKKDTSETRDEAERRLGVVREPVRGAAGGSDASSRGGEPLANRRPRQLPRCSEADHLRVAKDELRTAADQGGQAPPLATSRSRRMGKWAGGIGAMTWGCCSW